MDGVGCFQGNLIEAGLRMGFGTHGGGDADGGESNWHSATDTEVLDANHLWIIRCFALDR